MLFSSYEYLFLFLPIMVVTFFAIAKRSHTSAIWWLSLGSFFFYGSWNPSYLPLLICSIFVNFWVGKCLESDKRKRFKLIFGLAFNLSLLGYFKYTNFFVNNFNLLFGTKFQVEPIVLPLAISFFTFQQIVWIVDKYRGGALKSNLREFIGAVTFFPHLIAGPIVQYKHLIPQFENHSKTHFNWENIAQGLFLISVGAFKKLVIADTLSVYVGNGFDDRDFVDDMATYKDTHHYSETINHFVLQAIAKKDGLLRSENIRQYIATIKERVEAFDLKTLNNYVQSELRKKEQNQPGSGEISK